MKMFKLPLSLSFLAPNLLAELAFSYANPSGSRRRAGPKISKTYKPNGPRECARRMRQMAKGQS